MAVTVLSMLYWVGKNLKRLCVFSLKVKGLNHGIMCDISWAPWNSSRTCTKDCGLCYICTEFNIMFLWLKNKDGHTGKISLPLTPWYTRSQKNLWLFCKVQKSSYALFFSVVIFLLKLPYQRGMKRNALWKTNVPLSN